MGVRRLYKGDIVLYRTFDGTLVTCVAKADSRKGKGSDVESAPVWYMINGEWGISDGDARVSQCTFIGNMNQLGGLA